MTSSALSIPCASSVISKLATTIAEAQAALPATHQKCPIQDKVIANPDASIECIQN